MQLNAAGTRHVALRHGELNRSGKKRSRLSGWEHRLRLREQLKTKHLESLRTLASSTAADNGVGAAQTAVERRTHRSSTPTWSSGRIGIAVGPLRRCAAPV